MKILKLNYLLISNNNDENKFEIYLKLQNSIN